MKTLTLFLSIAMGSLVWTGCSKTNHSIRVTNSYSEDVQEVKINCVSTGKVADYGTVAKGATTDYKPIDAGDLSVSGKTAVSGQPLVGRGTVSGKGTHKWTMHITSAGNLTLVED